MFDVNLGNGARIFDQMIDFIALYLLTSQSAKTRLYGCSLVTQIWQLVLCLPVWLAIELKGALGNWRAAQGLET